MGTGPRPWQRNLSNLSVTSKVGIVLLLPVVLASVFAVLRIRDELGTISQLNTATQQAQIIRPLLDFGSAADDLAVAAGTGGVGDHIGQATLDQVSARFDQAAATLQSALPLARVDQQVSTEITDALSTGRGMRNSLHGSAAQVVGTQADEVATHISNAVTTLITPKETVLERYYTQLGDLTIARRMFLQQQLIIGSGEISNNPAMRAQALTATGSELTMINQYAVVQPTSAYKPDILLDAQQTRLRALSQSSAEPMMIASVNDSLQRSTATYTEAINHVADLITSGLSHTSIDARSTVLRDVASVVLTLLAGLALALAVARSLVVPVRRLRRGALQVAHVDLPAELSVVREGGATPEILPVDVQTTEEIGQLARAVDDMHRQALHLAADQARLRLLISSMFETLSRRSQSLVEQQLTLIEDLERDEENPGRLQSLFRLDHLATRMRRNGDNLLVLAGTALRRGQLPPVPLSDMLWSAVSQVEDYQRVEIGAVPDGIVAGEPAVDIEHLLAELIDNSLRYSPPSTPVAVSVSAAPEGGYLIEITDRGLGMSGDDLHEINDRLASGGEVTVETARRMGLYVVGRLAKRHTVTVSLRRTSTMAQQPGITATIHLPKSLIVSDKPESGEFPGAPLPAAPTSTAAHAAPEEIPAPVPLFGSSASVTPLPQRRPAREDSGDSATPEKSPVADNRPTGLFISQHDPEPVPDDEPTGLFVSHQDPEPVADGVIGYQPQEQEQNPFAHAGETARDPWAVPDRSALSAADRDEDDDEPVVQDWSNSASSWTPPESVSAEQDWDTEEPQYQQGPDVARWKSGDAWSGAVRWEETGSEPAQQFWADARPEPSPASEQPWGRTDSANSTTESGPGISGEQILRPRRRRPAPEPWPSGEFPPMPANVPASAPAEPARAPSWESEPADLWAQTATLPVQQPGAPEPAESPIYQRMVSEWLVEPSANETGAAWSSPADAGWAAAEEASKPTMDHRTSGGLPIRNPGAQLVPGGLTPPADTGAPDPEEIRSNLSRHLSGVRSGRAGLASYGDENGYNGTRSGGGLEHHDAQYNDGGHV
ncbi:ATP-binding protein [Nocardia jiangxiensis]|uniref:ATP-binding protein n=1 Tax=Nocardia jiangxiensis TaxID=282685 RepID=UPI0003149715|nr:ATP-binding protein [Nocardia jiangxiensis]